MPLRATYFLSGTFFLVTSTLQAQNTLQVGPLASLNGTSVNQSGSWTISPRVGLEAGVQGVVQLGHLAVQPSLRYSQKGFRETSTNLTDKYDTRFDYLTLPLNLAYSLRADGQGWQLLAGPYASLLLGGRTTKNSTFFGHVKAGDYPRVPPVGSTTYDAYYHRFDMGLQAGLGYRFGKLLVQAVYSYGLTDTAPWFGSSKHRGVQLTLSYLFTMKRT